MDMDWVHCGSLETNGCQESIATPDALLHKWFEHLLLPLTQILGCISQLETKCTVFFFGPIIEELDFV